MRKPTYTRMDATERKNLVECSVCGSSVSNQKQHDAWHELLPTFLTPLEEIPFPKNPDMYQVFSFEGEHWQYMSDEIYNTYNGWIRYQ